MPRSEGGTLGGPALRFVGKFSTPESTLLWSNPLCFRSLTAHAAILSTEQKVLCAFLAESHRGLTRPVLCAMPAEHSCDRLKH